MATDIYDLHTIDYSVQGWDSILTTDMEKLDAVVPSRILTTLGETIAEGEALYLKASDNKWYKALADGTKQPSHGVACEAGVLNDVIRLQIMGQIVVSTWSWPNLDPVYLDPTTPGALTQTKPPSHVQLMGYPLSATKIRVSIFDNATDITIDELLDGTTYGRVRLSELQDGKVKQIRVVEDAGIVTLTDMSVSATPGAGTEMSWGLKIDETIILKIYAEADGAGGIKNIRAISEGPVNLKEITTPVAVPDYGAIYTKTDNKLYFQDGAGVEHEIFIVGNYYAEMYLDSNAVATVIETADTPIALRHCTAGSLSGWTFNAGSTGAITAYTDYGGTVAGTVKATSAAHGLTTGDVITIRGTTSYNGIFAITVIDVDNFYFTDTWVADDGASDWDEGDYLIAGSGAAGVYAISWGLSLTEGGTAGSILTGQLCVGASIEKKSIGSRKFATNDKGGVSGRSIVSISDGERVCFLVISSGTNDITAKYGNLSLRRR